MRANSPLHLVTPGPISGQAAPPRQVKRANHERKYLTPDEVERLARVAGRRGRNGLRDRALIRVAANHGFRVSELVELRWDVNVDLRHEKLHITRRKKSGTGGVHPLYGSELPDLRALRRQHPHSQFVFVSERGGHIEEATVRKMVATVGRVAGFPFRLRPHALRHAAGYRLANEGREMRDVQVFLGHKNITNTAWYMTLAADRFVGFAKD